MKVATDWLDILIVLVAGCVGGWPMALSAWVLVGIFYLIFAR